MAECTGRSRVFFKAGCFAATPSQTQTRLGSFSTSVFNRTLTCHFFATTCGGQPMAGKPGWNVHPTEALAEATNNGSQSIRPPGRDMAFNISQTTALTAAAAACNSNAPPMAASPGKLQLLFLTGPSSARSTWTAMATSSLVAKVSPILIVCARATRRLAAKRLLSTASLKSTWAAALVREESIQPDWMDSYFWRSIAPAPRLTIIFTCWPVWYQRGEAQPT